MFRILSVLVLVVVLGLNAIAQEGDPFILLMTGKVVKGTVTSSEGETINYDFKKSNGKLVQKELDAERVFSIVDAKGEERVVYAVDTAIGNFFTVEEMRLYIKGEQDAMEGYHANWVLMAGLPITAGAGYLLNNNVVVLAVPFVYLMCVSLPKYRVNPARISSQDLLTSPAYILGYERTAQSKRLFKALGSAVIGTALGMAVGQSIN